MNVRRGSDIIQLRKVAYHHHDLRRLRTKLALSSFFYARKKKREIKSPFPFEIFKTSISIHRQKSDSAHCKSNIHVYIIQCRVIKNQHFLSRNEKETYVSFSFSIAKISISIHRKGFPILTAEAVSNFYVHIVHHVLLKCKRFFEETDGCVYTVKNKVYQKSSIFLNTSFITYKVFSIHV